MALQVTPLQAGAVKIPGWSTASARTPAPASTAISASPGDRDEPTRTDRTGDNGKWPPAKSATRRYYSGKNTNGWQATKVNEPRRGSDRRHR